MLSIFVFDSLTGAIVDDQSCNLIITHLGSCEEEGSA